MKIINSKASINRHITIFKDPVTGEHLGFSGIVEVNNEYVFINTKTGAGYDKVVKKLNRLVGYLASKYKLKGNTLEDNKQNVILHILEGIPKYNPFKNTQLSSFLQMRVERRLINEIRNENRLSKNATTLNTQAFGITCGCGNEYVSYVSKKIHLRDVSCERCEAPANKQRVVILSNNELSLESVMDNFYDGDFTNPDDISDESDILQQQSAPLDDSVITMHDLQKWLADEDPRVVKIIELVCFKDYSVRTAAQEVGLTGAGASLKLKGLKNKQIVRELLGR